jgi:hypothetical protein
VQIEVRSDGSKRSAHQLGHDVVVERLTGHAVSPVLSLRRGPWAVQAGGQATRLRGVGGGLTHDMGSYQP